MLANTARVPANIKGESTTNPTADANMSNVRFAK